MTPLPNVDAEYGANVHLLQPEVVSCAPITPVGRIERVGEAAETRNVETRDGAVVSAASECMIAASFSGTGSGMDAR